MWPSQPRATRQEEPPFQIDILYEAIEPPPIACKTVLNDTERFGLMDRGFYSSVPGFCTVYDIDYIPLTAMIVSSCILHRYRLRNGLYHIWSRLYPRNEDSNYVYASIMNRNIVFLKPSILRLMMENVAMAEDWIVRLGYLKVSRFRIVCELSYQGGRGNHNVVAY